MTNEDPTPPDEKPDAPWPADKVERRPVASLAPYARNARTHSDAQVDQIVESIRQFGWTVPVLVDTAGVLIAGHGRVLAAQRMGLTEVPTMVADGWTEEQVRAYRIADNKLALNSGWEMDTLTFELGELRDAGFNLDLTGFANTELDDLFGDKGANAPDPHIKLSERFGIPPFSVLNAREGWWQNRKRAWVALGIRSELGRGGAMGQGAAVPGEGGATAIYRKGASFKYPKSSGSDLLGLESAAHFQKNAKPAGP